MSHSQINPFAESLPDKLTIRRGVTKRVLKSALREFADLIQGASSRFPQIFNPDRLAKTWEAFVGGSAASSLLKRIAMFAVWSRVFNLR